MRTLILGVAAALALAAALTGCGSADHSRPASSGHAAPSGTLQLPTGAGGSATVLGHEVFGRECSVCHSLSGHSSPKQQGGDLLHDPLSRAVLVQFTSEMPVRHRLTRAELNAVVDYVLAVQKRAGVRSGSGSGSGSGGASASGGVG